MRRPRAPWIPGGAEAREPRGHAAPGSRRVGDRPRARSAGTQARHVAVDHSTERSGQGGVRGRLTASIRALILARVHCGPPQPRKAPGAAPRKPLPFPSRVPTGSTATPGPRSPSVSSGARGEERAVIRQYVDQALRLARYDKLGDGSFCSAGAGSVPVRARRDRGGVGTGSRRAGPSGAAPARRDGAREEGQLMPPWGPVSRRRPVSGLRDLGFEGPLSGGKHEFMVRGDIVVTIPTPHGRDVGVELLAPAQPP